MITLTKSGNAIVFTFSDNAHYLFDGAIEMPVNSLTLVTDNSQMATFRKSASNDIFISATYAELGMSKSELESWFKENACGSTGGGGVTSGEVETMIETSLEDYYDIDEIDAALSAKANTATTYTKTDVDNALANKADTSAVTAVNSSLTAHTADTDIHVTSADKTAWNAKSDFSGSYNDLTDKPTIPTVPTSNTAFTNDAGYITSGEAATQIEAATSGKADTTAVTASISAAVSGKADTTAFTAYSAATDARLAEDEEVTAAGLNALNDALGDKADTSAVTASIAAAVSGKQDTLVAGSGITISGNVISSEGGGGKAIVAGRGIEVTTGATADTVSFSLPISAGTGINSIRVAHTNNTASGLRSFAGGEGCTANKNDAFAFGLANTATSTGATAFGFKTNASVCSSFVCGKWNAIANANTGENFGSSGNTVFAVGNGWKKNDWTSGSANTHNALDIRQNGDIYFPDTDNTTYQNYYEKPMVRLQDMYGALGGLKLVKITQAAYDALATKDNSTLYVIVG